MYFSIDEEENSVKFRDKHESGEEGRPLDGVEAVATGTAPSLASSHCTSLSIIPSSGDPDKTSGRRESDSALSSWEKWVVKKAYEERRKREEEHRLKLEKQRAAKIQKKSQVEKLKRSDKAYQQWLRDKVERQKDSESKRKIVSTDKAKLTKERQEAAEAKAKKSYEEWCVRKRQERKENERLQIEAQKKQAKAEQEKRERGERAYNAWMKVNSRRHVETDWYGRLEVQSPH